MRVSHHVLRHSHLGAVYVDDFLFLLPRAVAVPMATLLVAFFQAMGVPISWKKLQLGFGADILRMGYLLEVRLFGHPDRKEAREAPGLNQLVSTPPEKGTKAGVASIVGVAGLGDSSSPCLTSLPGTTFPRRTWADFQISMCGHGTN